MPSFDAAVRRYNNLVYCNHKITIFMTLLRLLASLGCTQLLWLIQALQTSTTSKDDNNDNVLLMA